MFKSDKQKAILFSHPSFLLNLRLLVAQTSNTGCQLPIMCAGNAHWANLIGEFFSNLFCAHQNFKMNDSQFRESVCGERLCSVFAALSISCCFHCNLNLLKRSIFLFLVFSVKQNNSFPLSVWMRKFVSLILDSQTALIQSVMF